MIPVETDKTPVQVLGEALAPVFWRGKQWAVTEAGIEALDGKYFIDKERMLEGIEDHSWPMHMTEKTWIDADDFATAWMVAILLHGHGSAVEPEAIKQTLTDMRSP
jgi:hypothetical protein